MGYFREIETFSTYLHSRLLRYMFRKPQVNKAESLTSMKLQSRRADSMPSDTNVEEKRGLQCGRGKVQSMLEREVSSHWTTWGKLLAGGGT